MNNNKRKTYIETAALKTKTQTHPFRIPFEGKEVNQKPNGIKMCFTKMNGPHVEISGVATLCFDQEGTWFQGSISAEDDTQYAIYGTKSLRKRSGTGEKLFFFFF